MSSTPTKGIKNVLAYEGIKQTEEKSSDQMNNAKQGMKSSGDKGSGYQAPAKK